MQEMVCCNAMFTKRGRWYSLHIEQQLVASKSNHASSVVCYFWEVLWLYSFIMGENIEYGVSFPWKSILSYISKMVIKVEWKGRIYKVCFHTLLPHAHHLDEMILSFILWVNRCSSHELFWKFTLKHVKKCPFHLKGKTKQYFSSFH